MQMCTLTDMLLLQLKQDIKQKLFFWKITFCLFFFYLVRDVKSANSTSQFIQARSSIIIQHTLIHCEINRINWFSGLFIFMYNG